MDWLQTDGDGWRRGGGWFREQVILGLWKIAKTIPENMQNSLRSNSCIFRNNAVSHGPRITKFPAKHPPPLRHPSPGCSNFK